MRALITGLAFSLCLCAAAAQNAPFAKVVIPLIVENSHHKPVTGLTRESLGISEHKVPVADFALISAASFPLQLGIVIDASGSERSYDLDKFLVAARDFAQGAMRLPEDRVFFMEFDSKPRSTPWLRSEELAGVPTKVTGTGGTALYDAISAACNQKMGEPDSNKPTRRVLIVISDGEDNSSHVTLGRAIREAVSSGTVIFSLDVNPSSVILRGSKVMEDLARLTGGEVVPVSDRKNGLNAFGRFSELMRGMYFLSYTPNNRNPNKQNIELKPATGEKLYFFLPKSNVDR